MLANIHQAAPEGTLASKLKTYTAPSIPVIDDVGLLPMERGAASAFYQVINERYETQHSTIVTNRSVPDWSETSRDTVVASAILDRLMRAVVFNIKGPPGGYENTTPHHRDRRPTVELTSPVGTNDPPNRGIR